MYAFPLADPLLHAEHPQDPDDRAGGRTDRPGRLHIRPQKRFARLLRASL